MVVNDKMRTVRCCKDKMGTVSAAHLVYIELGPEEPMDTILVVLGGKLVVDGALCMDPTQGSRPHPCKRGSVY